jgi:dimethylsulfone monooxygenase
MPQATAITNNGSRIRNWEQRVSLEDYSVSNGGLRSGLVVTPQQVADRIGEFERAGVDLLLLQCSPQMEEMGRFSEQVIKPHTLRVAAM